MSEHDAATAAESGQSYARQTGWRGLIVFAGTMMILLGSFHAMAGLVALFQEEYYLVARSGLVVDLDFAAWGWAHLILGVVVALAGVAVMSGRLWGQIVAVVLALLSAIVNLAFLSAYPLWSAIMITLDVLVIYAITAHGDR